MQKRGTPFDVFQFRDYRYAQIGVFVSQISTQMLLIAINWHIYLITKSALSLGIIGAARFIPTLTFSLFAGLAADTFNRKKLIFVSQGVLVLTSLFLAALTFNGTVSSYAIYVLMAVNALALVFSSPALQSILPHLVPRDHFIKAVSLNGLMWQLATIIGPAIGGFIIGLFGVGYVYIITVVMYLSLGIAIMIIKPLPKNANRPEMNLRSIRQGMGFVKRTPLIWSTMLLDFFATFFASATTLMPIFAKDILNVGPQGLGILYAAPSVGAIIAGLIFSSLHSVRKQGKILLVSVLLYGVATVVFGLSQVYVLSLLALCVAGATDSISSIIRNTIRQLVTPDNLRGRMVSVTMIFYTGGPQLGEVEAGIAATILGTPLSVVFGGAGTIVVTVIMAYIVPMLRRYDSHNQLG